MPELAPALQAPHHGPARLPLCLCPSTCKLSTLFGIGILILLGAVQIPKLIALASVALRVQWREADEHLDDCTTNMMAVGGLLHLDILSLPVPASKANGWTLRAVTPETRVIHRYMQASACIVIQFMLGPQIMVK